MEFEMATEEATSHQHLRIGSHQFRLPTNAQAQRKSSICRGALWVVCDPRKLTSYLLRTRITRLH